MKNNYKLKQILVMLVMMNKAIIDWSLEHLLGKNITDNVLDQENFKVQVVATEDLGYGIENTSFSFIRTKKLLDSLSKEHRELLEKEVLSINDVFSDKTFIRAYFYGSHEMLMKVIEAMYFEGRINARMLRTLVEVGLIELTPKDYQCFGEMKLLYSWDDPIYIDAGFTDEEMLEAFKSAYGIK